MTTSPVRPIPRQVLTVNEVAQALGISRTLAYQLVSSGRLPHLRLGKRIVIPRSGIQHLLDQATRRNGDE